MKLNKINIKYDCPTLKKEMTKEIDKTDIIASSDIYDNHGVMIFISCECREYHNFQWDNE